VLFGEALDRNDVAAAHLALADADLCVVIGTSGSVWPASELPAMAARGGIDVIYVDPGEWRGPHAAFAAHVDTDADTAVGLLQQR
jgi:NAD-dependent SIR2 family protein deacetylase